MSEALNQWLGLALFMSFFILSMVIVYRSEIKYKLDKHPRWRITIIQAPTPKECRKAMTVDSRILRRSPTATSSG